MLVVARSIPAVAAVEAAAWGAFGGVVRKAEGWVVHAGSARHGRRRLLRQALPEGDKVDAGQWRCFSSGWLLHLTSGPGRLNVTASLRAGEQPGSAHGG